MKTPHESPTVDFKSLFESAPDLYLILSPSFEIIAASNAYLDATLTKREAIIGRGLFDVFPDNPDDVTADGVTNLRSSLMTVLATKAPNKMQIQKYDVRDENGEFSARFWSPLNTPVLGKQNEVEYIIHRVEDVTATELARKILEEKDQQQAESERRHANLLRDSETRFTTIFNLSPVAIFITNAADGRLMLVNRSFERLFEIKKEDAIGKTVIELGFIDKDSRMHLAQHVLEEGGHNVEMEIDVHTSKNELKQVFVSTEVIEMEGRSCFLKAMIDITQRKQYEDELRRTNHFLDNILDNMPSVVIVKDAVDLKLLQMNKAAESLLGMKRESLLGKTAYDVYPKEQADFFAQRDRKVFESGELQELEETLDTYKGERWLNTRKIPVYENEKPLYLLGISLDITEKKKHENDIVELNKELEAFSYSVAHDLRAPLRAITGFSKMLESDLGASIGQDVLVQLRKISKNAEHMGCLIDDLLAFSKLGKKQLKLENINMNQLVDWALAEISKFTEYKAEINTAKLSPVKADFTLMSQVMINLIGNAIKYSSKKEKPIIFITSYVSGGDIVYSVADNGAGFDMRYIGKLFGVFQRLHRSDEFEGSGVGLAIVNRIVSKHNGRVWATGKVNEGATFYFSLPAG